MKKKLIPASTTKK